MNKASKWCVRPLETDKIPLVWDSEDSKYEFWVRFKQRLTVGEARQVANAGWSGFRPPSKDAKAEISVNWQDQAFTRMLVWLTAWSLDDDSGDRLPITRDVVESLDQEVFALMEGALTKHIEAQEEEKKLKSGSTTLQPTSA